MSESQSQGMDWIRQWIEQQRLSLQQGSTAAGQSNAGGELAERMRELSSKWLELGKSYGSGGGVVAQSAGSEGANAAATFKIGPDFFNPWQGAWAGSLQISQNATNSWLDLLSSMPPIGIAREQTESWRELAAAQAECQRLDQQLRTMLTGVQTEALNMLDQRVREREQKGVPIANFRDLYDLWVECGEHVYARVARSEEYCKVQGLLGNAMMTLRVRQQKVIEHGLKRFDLPTRSEINSVHRQLRDQEQQIRELKQQLSALQAQAGNGADVSARVAPEPIKSGQPAPRARTAKRKSQ